MDSVSCRLSTPTRTHNCSDGELVLLPGQDGEIGVLSHHIPMIIALTKGEVRILRSSNLIEVIKIDDGIAHIKEEGIEILCTNFMQVI